MGALSKTDKERAKQRRRSKTDIQKDMPRMAFQSVAIHINSPVDIREMKVKQKFSIILPGKSFINSR